MHIKFQQRIWSKSLKEKENFKKQCSCFGVLKAKYNSDNLKVILGQWFKDKLIGDLECPVAILAVNYSTGMPVVFKTPHHSELRRDFKLKIVDVALAASAAPTYFKRHKIGESEYIDGGLFANSPTLIGLHEAEIFFKKPINNKKCFLLELCHQKKRSTLKQIKKVV